ncbi:MAG: hypothetical protein IPL19_18720 [Sandaracinaceae bacterium]|nr:hypothetical protein [Sandaracinaceae bacterium]
MLERLKLPTDIEAPVAPSIPTSTYLLEDLARFSPAELAARRELSASLRADSSLALHLPNGQR